MRNVISAEALERGHFNVVEVPLVVGHVLHLPLQGVDDSAADRDGDGYTNIEEYINGLVSDGADSTPPNAPANLTIAS